ncbi:zinc-binding dehydrogenase [Pseudonocardia ailaonensis]|uniref:Zinc-binding dehydrogenase n=1 Tax=Pseudonocardia ailaonensis TaxID=367279 RepID=A0ABN2MR28_9PSEU
MRIPATMRALQQTSLRGPSDTHLVADEPVPRPGPGEILVRVEAAGVNLADLSRARGTFHGGPRPPYVAGFEAAGEVVALGTGVEEPAPGTRVVGVGDGAFAEFAVLPAAGAVRIPEGWAAADALGLVVNRPAALAALRLGRVGAGETVLVHAAAGATGQAAVVLAKRFGAVVIGSASPAKHDTVRALGADHVVDSVDGDLVAEVRARTGGAGADLVLESVGGARFAESLAATRRVTGRVVVVGLAGGEAALTNWDLVYRHQVQLVGLNIGVLAEAAPQLFGELMGELFALVAAGTLGPARPAVHDLAEGPAVLAALEERATVGKLALRP